MCIRDRINATPSNARGGYSDLVIGKGNESGTKEPQIEFYNTSTSWAINHETTNSQMGFHYNNGSSWSQILALKSGSSDFVNTVTSSVDFRAPIFYDTDNTAYYCDPSSNSNVYRITAVDRVTSANYMQAPIFYDYNNSNYYTDPASTSILNYERVGSTLSVGTTSGLNSAGQIGVYSSSNPYISFHNNTLDRTAYIQESGSAFYLWEADFTEMSGSSRAPIFYDSGNTSYYVDPYSTSVLNYVNMYGTLQFAGNSGQSGQVLTSNGSSSPSWQDAGGGGTWTEVNTVTLGNTGSSSWQNWSITANKHYRFTFYDFDFAYYDDRIGARISCDGGSNFVLCYGTSAFRNGWSTMSWSTSNVANGSWLQLQGSSNIKGNDARYKGAYCEVHFYAPTNGGGNLYSRTWWPKGIQEMAYAEARYTTSSFHQTANYLRFQPYNYGGNSSQGFRGYLKVETMG